MKTILLIAIPLTLFHLPPDNCHKCNYTYKIWAPRKDEEAYGYKISDTTEQKIILRFEDSETDSLTNKNHLQVLIKLKDGYIVYAQKNTIAQIYYKNKKKSFHVKVIDDSGNCIDFYPILGYRYITFYKNLPDNWQIVYSNYYRLYE
jgi:hypothetical protein